MDASRLVVDPGRGPLALLGHGAGSTPDFVAACLAGPLRAAGWRVATLLMSGHGPAVERDPARLTLAAHAADLGAAADLVGAEAVGGISLAAHAAVTWAAGQRTDRLSALLLACPAWTGRPDAVADANAAQADVIERRGLAGALAQVHAGAPPWLAAEVECWWRQHDPASLVSVLRALADQSAPTPAMLAHLAAPVAVAVLDDDGLHPADVGRRWAALAPRGAVRSTTITALGHDRSALGEALVEALVEAQAQA